MFPLQQERREAELRAKREEEERKRREEKRRQEELKRREEEDLFRRKQVRPRPRVGKIPELPIFREKLGVQTKPRR